MDRFEKHVFFKRSLRILLKVLQFLGLVNFKYNRLNNRVEPSNLKRHLMTFALLYFGLISLTGTVLLIIGSVYAYCTKRINFLLKSEQLIFTMRTTFKLFNTFFFTLSYFKYRSIFVETLNEILVLFEQLERLTNDEGLYYPQRFRKLIYFRLVLFCASWIIQSRDEKIIGNVAAGALFFHSYTIMELTFWTHLYGNLTFLCFYQKMNCLLGELHYSSNESEIQRCIRKATSISHKIHCVKDKFNQVYTTHHFVCFLGLLSDIFAVYRLFKLLTLFTLHDMHMPVWQVVRLISVITFGELWTSFDLYLGGYLSEVLVESEKIFRRTLLTLECTLNSLNLEAKQQREIEMALLQHCIQDLSTRSFRLFVVDRLFLFEFVTDTVLCYAIIMLQVFIGDFVSASGKRLEILVTSVTSLSGRSDVV